MKTEDYYYQLWLKERENLIKITKESSELLDKNSKLEEKLTIMILSKTLKRK